MKLTVLTYNSLFREFTVLLTGISPDNSRKTVTIPECLIAKLTNQELSKPEHYLDVVAEV